MTGAALPFSQPNTVTAVAPTRLARALGGFGLMLAVGLYFIVAMPFAMLVHGAAHLVLRNSRSLGRGWTMAMLLALFAALIGPPALVAAHRDDGDPGYLVAGRNAPVGSVRLNYTTFTPDAAAFRSIETGRPAPPEH